MCVALANEDIFICLQQKHLYHIQSAPSLPLPPEDPLPWVIRYDTIEEFNVDLKAEYSA